MPPYAIFFLIFAAAILLYAIILGITRDPGMLPYHVQVSLQKRNREAYVAKLAKCVALTALAPAIAAVVGIWSAAGMLITFAVLLVLFLWLSTRIMS